MNTFYTQVYMDIPASYIKHVIGRNGKHLKNCRQQTGVQSVWYNGTRNLVSIYGPIDRLQTARDLIEKQLSLVRSEIPLELRYGETEYVEDLCLAVPLEGLLCKDDVKYLIGKKGLIFKQITNEANVSFIWYDDVEHRLRIWGPPSAVPCAIRMIVEHIERSNLSWVSQGREEYHWKLLQDSFVCPLTV
jgi:hypothetical protein